MKDETLNWVKFADENLKSAKLLFENNFYNPCLQNAQQSIEKLLKAVLIEKGIPLKRTHDILELYQLLQQSGIKINLSEDECDLLNSVYLPSKYPLGSALPDFNPDKEICFEVISIARNVLNEVLILLK
jgi:HEPN domain-containing protein